MLSLIQFITCLVGKNHSLPPSRVYWVEYSLNMVWTAASSNLDPGQAPTSHNLSEIYVWAAFNLLFGSLDEYPILMCLFPVF